MGALNNILESSTIMPVSADINTIKVIAGSML